jgi:hypothetical protein
VTASEPPLDFHEAQHYEVGDGMSLIVYEEPFKIQVNIRSCDLDIKQELIINNSGHPKNKAGKEALLHAMGI